MIPNVLQFCIIFVFKELEQKINQSTLLDGLSTTFPFWISENKLHIFLAITGLQMI